jgi:hypothetical protein
MWGWQERLIFPAPAVPRDLLDEIAHQVGARPVGLVAEDGTRLYAWHRHAEPQGGEPKAVLFFHGNAETVADRVPMQDVLVEMGWNVVVPAYRGYPGSEGVPSEQGLAMDARAAWDFVTGPLGVPGERVVVHGKSLGGGVAATLAETVEPGGLILESTFVSIADVAKSRFPIYPVNTLLKHRFDTGSRADRITCPVLILHADADATIPVENGRELARRFTGATYVEVPGLGHGESLPLSDPGARDAWLAVLDRVGAGR